MAEGKEQKRHLVKVWKDGFDKPFTYKVYAYTTLHAMYRVLNSYRTGEFNGTLVGSITQVTAREINTNAECEPCGTIIDEHPITYAVNGGQG